MARGFSHSGSSGGGRSGGGFSGSSFGGSSRRSSSGSGSSYHRPRGPMRVPMFGRVMVITTGMQTLFAFLFFFIFAAIAGLVTVGGAKSDYNEGYKEEKALVQKFEEYDVTFRDIIAKAQAGTYDNYKIVEGSYGDRKYTYYDDDPSDIGYYRAFYRNGAYYYFIVYEYEAPDGKTKIDSTFTQYLEQDVSVGYGENGTIEIACAKIGKEYWAINTDYSLSKNQDYHYAKAEMAEYEQLAKSTNTTMIVCWILLAALVVILALVIVKEYKKAKKQEAVQDAKNEADIAEAESRADIARKAAKAKGRVCDYCGNSIPDDEDKCPSCGSRTYK